jgi:hypothetical protein
MKTPIYKAFILTSSGKKVEGYGKTMMAACLDAKAKAEAMAKAQPKGGAK